MRQRLAIKRGVRLQPDDHVPSSRGRDTDETNPYGGQADSNVLTAREGSGGQPGHGPGGQRSL